MRHGLQLPSRSRDQRVQQRLANLENVPSVQRAAPMQVDGGRSRMIYGTINTTGPAIVSGSGFSVVRNGVGNVTITFTVAFGSKPSVTFSTEDAATNTFVKNNINSTTTQCQPIVITDAGVAVDRVFAFQAVGPA
jgi:hypothetical protein